MLKIYFDDKLMDSKWVRSLTQEANLFDSQFKLGSTLCRTFTLEVDKKIDSFVTHVIEDHLENELETNSLEYLLATLRTSIYNIKPTTITIKNDNVTYATLYVDEVDDECNAYFKYTLMDKMVLMNTEFTYDTTANKTVKQLVEQICTNHSIQLATQTFYLSDMVVTWTQDSMTERDFISYVAEVNGGYAYLNAQGNLVFKKYTNTVADTIQVEKCSSFKLGTKHIIDRVYVELASATKYYPETSDNETVYLNSDNILLTDSGSYTIDGIVRHIYDDIDGFNFYNIKVDRCPINQDVICGDTIKFTLDGREYKTIAQIQYTFVGDWFGGYELELDSAEQLETKVVSPIKKIGKEVKIIVDRELGTIKQEIKENTEDIAEIKGDAVFKVEVLYAKGDSQTVAPTSGWSTTAPEWEENKYIWQKTKTYYGDETSSESNPTCIQGAKGEDGENGVGISSIVEQYYLSTSSTSQTGGSWSNTCPTWETNKYIWTRSYITWDNGNTSTTTPTLANGINKANETATNTYNTLTTYYSTTEQTNSAISLAVSGSKTEILGEVSNTYATKASLSIYVTEDTAKTNVASWINACADNIVLNASSSLVFGDLENQYITVSNYTNDSGAKVGVLFDGTGDIRMTPTGRFDIKNTDNTYIWNQMWFTHDSSSLNNQSHIYNYDDENHMVNSLNFHASSNGYEANFYNKNYNNYNNYGNWIMLKSTSTSNTSGFVNRKINENSAANSIQMSAASSYNTLELYNQSFSSTNNANVCQLSSFETTNKVLIFNSKKDSLLLSNQFAMSHYANSNNSISLFNYNYGGDCLSNQIALNSYESYNKTRIENRTIDSPSSQSGYIDLTSNTTDNSIDIVNIDRCSGRVGNRVTLNSNTSSNSLVIKNHFPNGSINNEINLSANGLSMYNTESQTSGNKNKIGLESKDMYILGLDDLRIGGKGVLYLTCNSDTFYKPYYNNFKISNSISLSANYIYLTNQNSTYMLNFASDGYIKWTAVPQYEGSSHDGFWVKKVTQAW